MAAVECNASTCSSKAEARAVTRAAALRTQVKGLKGLVSFRNITQLASAFHRLSHAPSRESLGQSLRHWADPLHSANSMRWSSQVYWIGPQSKSAVALVEALGAAFAAERPPAARAAVAVGLAQGTPEASLAS